MSIRLPRSTLRVLLIVVCVLASTYQAGFSTASIDLVRHGVTEARAPLIFGFRLNVISGAPPEAAAAGIAVGDRLEQVEGRPFTGELILDEIVGHKHAGDRLAVVVRHPDGRLLRTVIKLAPMRTAPASLSGWTFILIINVVIPTFCLILGFWVAAARPYDRLAWLLLALMIGFSQNVQGFSWNWPWMPLAVVWNAATGLPFGLWLVWLVLFAVLFPTNAPFDLRWPWLKWLVLAPLIVEAAFFFVFQVGEDYSFAAIRWLSPLLWLLTTVPLMTYLSFVAISAFFGVLWYQGAVAASADARRRLRILYFGTAASLTPLFIVAVISIFRRGDIFDGLPAWARITPLLALLLFPLTMAYVIVVQRAMDIGVVLRQGLKYAVARQGLRTMRSALLAIAIIMVSSSFSDRHSSAGARTLAVLFLVLVVAVRRRFYEQASNLLDRRFFREAYSSDLVLSELGQEVRMFTEAQPLLATVAQRLSTTLHASPIAVFLREDERFCVAQTVGLETARGACLSPGGRAIGLLEEAKRPELVYFDDPRSWVHSAAPEEQLELRNLRAEVLLALPGRTELLGLIALGPKLSEQPYSPSDLRLLQSVAVQTGLALENTRLLATVAREAGRRERLNRELEIAREVQERLFPQSCPPVAGVDYFGACRPALAVGGDYYDYIPRDGGVLGMALGDVSGKGISAALMMASLQSLLRGQIEAGLKDVAALITNTNRLIYEVSTANRYVTFFYGEYDAATRRMVYVNAGHNPPIILRGGEVVRLEACGPVVGLLPGIRFESAVFEFEPGDVLLLFTDGMSEAMTIDDEEWTDDGLIEAARCCRDLDAREMTASIFTAADRFTAGAPQHDDMTLLAFKFA